MPGDNAMEKRSDFHFCYPPNIHELDLATMVSMYRARGEPRRAKPGTYFACSITQNLLKEGKWWFGLYYSQKTWDSLLTNGSEGYPLTDIELNVLGLIFLSGDEPLHRDYIEKNCGSIPKLAYLIVNDLKQFVFLVESEDGFLGITPSGERALHGISRRIYGKRFHKEMPQGLSPDGEDFVRNSGGSGSEQATLF